MKQAIRKPVCPVAKTLYRIRPLRWKKDVYNECFQGFYARPMPGMSSYLLSRSRNSGVKAWDEWSLKFGEGTILDLGKPPRSKAEGQRMAEEHFRRFLMPALIQVAGREA